jgi:hypothetical protein
MFTLEELIQSVIAAYETGKNTNVPVTLLQTSSEDTEQAKSLPDNNLTDVAYQLGHTMFAVTKAATLFTEQEQEHVTQDPPEAEVLFDKNSVAMQDIYNPEQALAVFRLHAVSFVGDHRLSVHSYVQANPHTLLTAESNYEIARLVLRDDAISLLEKADESMATADRLLVTALCVIATLMDNAGLVFYSLEKGQDNKGDFWLFRYYYTDQYQDIKSPGGPQFLQYFSLQSLLQRLLAWNEAVRLQNNLLHGNKQKDSGK